MNDFDDLDDLFAELRCAATDAELAGEASHVDSMARHHRRQKGHTMITSRRARVATFVAAGVIGFGGIAAASPGGPFALTGSDDTTTTTDVTTTTSDVTTTSEVPTTTSDVTTTTSTAEVVLEDDASITRSMIEETVEADDATLADDPDTDFDQTTCLDGNHGKTVSAVAREESPYETVEQRDAAQSSCGKDGGVDDADDADDQDKVDVEVEADDDDHDDDSDASARPEKPSRSQSPGRPESPGGQGNGSKKNSGD